MLVVYSVSFVWCIIRCWLFCFVYALDCFWRCTIVALWFVCGRFVCFDLRFRSLFSMVFLFVYFDLIIALIVL